MTPPPSDDPALQRLLAEITAVKARQDDLAVRCMALGNVVQGVAALLTASLPPAVAERLLKDLEVVPPLPLSPAMPRETLALIEKAVGGEQRQIVGRIRDQQARRAQPRPAAAS